MLSPSPTNPCPRANQPARGARPSVAGRPSRAATSTPAELAGWLARSPRTPPQWEHHLAFSSDERVYVSLHRDDHVDVWLLCWTPDNDTGWHDHDVSSGAVAVAKGSLVEHNLAIASSPVADRGDGGIGLLASAPTTSTASPVSKPAPSRCTPTPRRCGGWASTRCRSDGVLRRTSVSYADELRPLD